MGAFGIITSLLGKRTAAEELAQVYLVPMRNGGPKEDVDIGVWGLQYWPETISLTHNPEYANRSPVGASHPLYQYLRTGDRVLSFSCEFSRDLQGEIVAPGIVVGAGKVARDRYNVDVAQALIWMESFVFPLYGKESDPAGFDPPPMVSVVFPNGKLGRSAGGGLPTDAFLSVMASFGAKVDAWFPDGTIRHASVDVSFNEVVQSSNGIVFASRKLMATANDGGQKYGVPVARRVDR